MKPAEFDQHAASYDGGLDNSIKRLIGSSPDQFIAVKARWLLRREPSMAAGGLAVLDYGCGASPVAVGRHLEQRLPNARLHVVRGGDHDMAKTHAEQVAPLIARHLTV